MQRSIKDDPLYEPYPKTLKISRWMEFLGRELYPHEREIIHDVALEKQFNEKLTPLYNNCLQNNYFIPMLTHLHGNCLFECLLYGGIGPTPIDPGTPHRENYPHNGYDDAISNFRKALGYIMYQYRNYKGFFEGRDDTLKELFNMTNEIKYVYCKQDGKLYHYTYEIMCQDLANDSSWGSLPTQLILLVISNLYRLDFQIVSNSFSQLTHTSAFEALNIKPYLKVFKLGHILENHYMPIDELVPGQELVPLWYNTAKEKFYKFGSAMERYVLDKKREKLGVVDEKKERENEEKKLQANKNIELGTNNFSVL